MKTFLIAIATICVGAAVGWGGRQLLRRLAAPPADAESQSNVTSVTPPRMEIPRAPDEGFVGVVLAQETVDIVAKSQGRIQEMGVRLGDHVRSGDRLVVLDSAAIRHELAMAKAELRAAEGDAEKVGFEAREAAERLSRRKPLAQGGEKAISSEELATSQYAEKLAASRLKTARATVTEKHERVAQLETLVDETQIKAPFDGIVAARYVDVGAVVGPTTPLLRLIDPDDLWVRFAVPEDRAGAVAKGMPIQVAVEAAAEVAGRIETVAPEVDTASRMVIVEARLSLAADEKRRIRSGLVARVHVPPSGVQREE